MPERERKKKWGEKEREREIKQKQQIIDDDQTEFKLIYKSSQLAFGLYFSLKRFLIMELTFLP